MTTPEPRVAGPVSDSLAIKAVGVLTLFTLALAVLVFLFGALPLLKVACLFLAVGWIALALGHAAARLGI